MKTKHQMADIALTTLRLSSHVASSQADPINLPFPAGRDFSNRHQNLNDPILDQCLAHANDTGTLARPNFPIKEPDMNIKSKDMKSSSHSGKNRLRQFIRLALAGSVLTSGMASAVLLDHGPNDPTLTWPQWYRDTNGTALGLCKSQVASPNGAAGSMCFPPAPDPAGFVGNLGPEMFYSMVGFKNTATGSDFRYRYVAGVEASYLPLGVPIHGTETVFARVRIALNFNSSAKNGTYRVIHPYGVETFENVQATNNSNLFGANAAVFFTADVPLAATMNFDLALGGAIGPFVEWDVLQAGESLTVGGTTFLGDPNVPHTFTGSPFGTNFIRIEGPAGSNLDGAGHDFIEDHFGTVLGQVWGAPIAQALNIDAAYLSRSAANTGVNSIDVWATSAPNQKLLLTDSTPGGVMPSLQMLADGVIPGKYYGHIEYPVTQQVPSSVVVTNVTSNPIVSKSAVLTDGVEISTAVFDTKTGDIAVVAHSTNQFVQPSLAIEGVPDVPSAVKPSALTAAQCAQVTQLLPAITTFEPGDVCFFYTLPAAIQPPESISVLSTEFGTHADHLVSIVGNPQNQPGALSASDFIGVNGFSVATSAPTPLSNASGTLPLDALIIAQPTNGNIALAGGTWTFTPTAGALPGPDSFKYVRQSANNAPVSNVAAGELTLLFQSQAPTANLDQFAALSANPQVTTALKVLSNDKAATTNPADQLDPASVTIVTLPTRGSTALNADGTIGYKATSGGGDSFTYTVKNSTGQVSNTATVQLTNFTGPESVSVGKVNYTISQNKWVVVGSTNWFGPNLTQMTATCWTGTGAAPTAGTLIGSAPIDTTGKFQLAPVGNTPVGVNNQQVTCQTSSGKTGVGTTVAK